DSSEPLHPADAARTVTPLNRLNEERLSSPSQQMPIEPPLETNLDTPPSTGEREPPMKAESAYSLSYMLPRQVEPEESNHVNILDYFIPQSPQQPPVYTPTAEVDRPKSPVKIDPMGKSFYIKAC